MQHKLTSTEQMATDIILVNKKGYKNSVCLTMM